MEKEVTCRLAGRRWRGRSREGGRSLRGRSRVGWEESDGERGYV